MFREIIEATRKPATRTENLIASIISFTVMILLFLFLGIFLITNACEVESTTQSEDLCYACFMVCLGLYFVAEFLRELRNEIKQIREENDYANR